MQTAVSLAGASPSIVATRLAQAGLVPFVLGALLVWLVRPEAVPYVALALAGYAAATLSFLGGIHWGIAFRQTVPSPVPFVWGVLPSLVAAVAVIMPASAGLVILGAMLLACYLVDRRLYPPQGLAAWLTLRFRLSGVACASCWIAAAGA